MKKKRNIVTNNVETKVRLLISSSIDVVQVRRYKRESHNDAEAARYENRKQREQTVIKTAAREQSNDGSYPSTETSHGWKFA